MLPILVLLDSVPGSAYISVLYVASLHPPSRFPERLLGNLWPLPHVNPNTTAVRFSGKLTAKSA